MAWSDLSNNPWMHDASIYPNGCMHLIMTSNCQKWSICLISLNFLKFIHTCIHASMHSSIHLCMHASNHDLQLPKMLNLFNLFKMFKFNPCMHPCHHASIHTCMHLCVHAFIHAKMLSYKDVKTYKGLDRTELSNLQNTCMHVFMISNCQNSSICLICFKKIPQSVITDRRRVQFGW